MARTRSAWLGFALVAAGGFAPATTQVESEVREVSDPIGVRHPTGPMVYVWYDRFGWKYAWAAVVSPGATWWFDSASVTAIAWHFGRSDLIVPVEAVVGAKTWPFLLEDPAERRAVLAVTEEIREAWEADGVLEFWCGGSPVFELRARPRSLRIGPEGASFTVGERSSAFVPGSREWVVVFLDEISGGRVRLGVRTAPGAILAVPRSVGAEDDVTFGIEEEEYSIRVERLRTRPDVGGSADLRVRRRDGRASPGWGHAPGEAGRPGSGGDGQGELPFHAPEAASADVLRAKVLELIEAEVGSALQEARRSREDVRRGFRWIQGFASRGDPQAESLSVIRVRILRAGPAMEVLSEHAAPGVREYGLFLARRSPFPQYVEAQVLETHAVGMAYYPRTLLGRRHPTRLRSDLRPGKTVELSVQRGTGVSIERGDQGREYWLVIAPPFSRHFLPALIGEGGRSAVLFAMPVRNP